MKSCLHSSSSSSSHSSSKNPMHRRGFEDEVEFEDEAEGETPR
jgi:hypothetical protein